MKPISLYFDPNPFSPASSGPGAPSLFNKWLAEQAIHALSFDHLRAVSPCRSFPPSSCSCLKVEVIPPERNTLGVLQSINLFLLFLLFPWGPPSQLEQIPLFLPPPLSAEPRFLGRHPPLCGCDPPWAQLSETLPPGQTGDAPPLPSPNAPPPPAGSGSRGERLPQASVFACAAFCFLEGTHCFPMDAAFLWPPILPFPFPRRGLGLARGLPRIAVWVSALGRRRPSSHSAVSLCRGGCFQTGHWTHFPARVSRLLFTAEIISSLCPLLSSCQAVIDSL